MKLYTRKQIVSKCQSSRRHLAPQQNMGGQREFGQAFSRRSVHPPEGKSKAGWCQSKKDGWLVRKLNVRAMAGVYMLHTLFQKGDSACGNFLHSLPDA